MILVGVSAVYVAVSAVVFVMFAVDKHAATRGRRRIPEATLHTAELLGGWPGALLGMRLLRHKSSKRRYQAVTAAIIVVHAAAWVLVLWWS